VTRTVKKEELSYDEDDEWGRFAKAKEKLFSNATCLLPRLFL